jgi:hypothetical protein
MYVVCGERAEMMNIIKFDNRKFRSGESQSFADDNNSKHSKTSSTEEPLLNSNGGNDVDSNEEHTSSSSFSNDRKR